jgi:hypothetical protein
MLPPPPYPAAAIVGLRVGLNEVELRRRAKLAGGKWNPQRRLWEVRYDQAKALSLESRIERPSVSTNKH